MSITRRFDAPVLTGASTRAQHAHVLRNDHDRAIADGFDTGLRRAEEHVASMTSMLAASTTAARRAGSALGAAAASLAAADVRLTVEMERAIGDLAIALAGELLGHETRLEGAAVAAVTRVIGLVPRRDPLVVRVHPDDVGAVRAVVVTIDLPHGAVVHADHSVGPGECIVDAGPLRIDARSGPALDRARTVLADLYGTTAVAEGETR